MLSDGGVMVVHVEAEVLREIPASPSALGLAIVIPLADAPRS
jgi:hypothetical protein